MYSIPLKAKVQCSDDACGESVAIVMDPEKRQVTHFVVEDKSLPEPQTRIVALDAIADSSPTTISLRCAKSDLATMDPFVQTRYIQIERPVAPPGGYMSPGSAAPEMETVEVPEQEENIPVGAIALHRGSRVEASDGAVGQVDELVVDPETSEVTQVALLAGHFWDRKVVLLPISAIDHVEQDVVHLKLDKQAVSELPDMPANSYYQSGGIDASANL